MLRFVLRKMANKKWMVFALLIGNILLISITCSNAMYGNAVLQRTLMQSLNEYLSVKNNYPGLIGVNAGGSPSKNHLVLESNELMQTLPEAYGLPSVENLAHLYTSPVTTKSELNRADSIAVSVTMATMTGLEDHIELVAGEMYSDTPAEDGTIDILLSESGLAKMNLLLNECFTLPQVLDDDGEPVRVRVCGVFRNSSADDIYWVQSPAKLTDRCFMPYSQFDRLFMQEGSKIALYARLYQMLDYTVMRTEQVEHLLSTAAYYEEYFGDISGQNYYDYFSDTLTAYTTTAKKVNVTLWVLQVPIFMLLAAFIFMVSRQMLEMEQNEIAVLKSRGASRRQIITTYLIQSLVVTVISLAIGIPLGAYLVQVLGSANAFLEFVKRSSLEAEINSNTLLFAGIASLFSILTMVLPVFRHSNVTIVNHKRKKSRKSEKPMWQRMFLDVAVLAVSLYGLYTYNGQKELLAQRVQDGASLDPLLFISSSLFMIGAALFALRVLPVITFIIYRIFKRWWSPALYASFLRVIRTRYSQSFIMVFLILTIALGVFNAQAARTINSNEEDNLRYRIGADIVLREKWNSNAASLAGDPMTGAAPQAKLTYDEPDFDRYQVLIGSGATSITKVLHITDATMNTTGSGRLGDLHVMGIHTKSFGETVWFKGSLLPNHFYEYLNALASNPRAVLLTRNFQTTYGYKLGDAIYYQNSAGDSARGIVFGFVDYWPGYMPTSYTRLSDGTYREKDNFMVIANLNQLQSSWGVTPYEIWIDAEDSTQFIYEFIENNNIQCSSIEDSAASIVALKNNPVFQGTNGILTVGFIVVLMLCAVGFLVYWILSITGRALQFGIYRAMGMTMREVITMLIGEQLFISGTAIATGALVGWLTSTLYMPLIQMAYASYDNALPLNVISEQNDMIRLFVIVGAMIVICMLVLGWLISRMRIAQALKLGED